MSKFILQLHPDAENVYAVHMDLSLAELDAFAEFALKLMDIAGAGQYPMLLITPNDPVQRAKDEGVRIGD